MLVSLIFRATGLSGIASGTSAVSGAIRGLASSAIASSGGLDSLTGSITSGILQANIYGQVLGKATQAIGKLQEGLGEAQRIQIANISAATAFSSISGQSAEAGLQFIETMTDRLAKSAAALPGATQDYKSLGLAIQDNVLEAFKSANGVDMSGFTNSITTLSESYGALSAASSVPVQNTVLGLSKALGGASTASLRQIQFFEQNQVILNEIDKRLEAIGKKSLGELNIRDRVRLLEEVGKKFITEDFKKQASQSVEGLTQTFKSNVFDPSSGIFGWMRDLDPGKKGTQSAFAAYNTSLNTLIGSGGTIEQLTKTFELMGLTVDPMKLVETAILYFNGGLTRFNEILSGVNLEFGKGTIDGFKRGFSILFHEGFGGILKGAEGLLDVGKNAFSDGARQLTPVLQGLGGAIGEGISSLPNMDFSPLFSNIGGVINGYLDTISKLPLYAKFDPAKMFTQGDAIGRVAGKLIAGLVGMIAQIDWGKAAGSSANIQGNLSVFVGGLLAGIIEGAILQPINDVCMLVGELIEQRLSSMGGAIGGFLSENLDKSISFIGSGINGIVEQGSSLVGGAIDGTKAMFAAYLGLLTSTVSYKVATGAVAIGGTIVEQVTRIYVAIGTGIGGLANAAATDVNATFTLYAVQISQQIEAGTGVLAGLGQQLYIQVIAWGTPIANSMLRLGHSIDAGVEGAIGVSQNYITGLASGIGDSINLFVNSTQTAFSTFTANLVAGITGGLNAIAQFFQGKINGAIGAVTSLLPGGLLPAAPSLPSLPTLPALSGVPALPSVPQVQGAIQAATISLGDQAVGAINNLFGNKASGNIPYAAMGLLDALTTESRAKPHDSRLVIANDSELILNRSQVRELGQSATPNRSQSQQVGGVPSISGGGFTSVRPVSVSVGDINIASASGEPLAIAEAVISAIQSRLADAIDSQLTT